INFSSGELTVTAKGSRLLKCKDWDFSAQECKGEWAFIMQIYPGENYSLAIDAVDPAYAEVGLASINTEKPLYHPGETAKLIVVALDNQGSLVTGANLTISVISPEGAVTNLTSQDLDITEEERGVYTAYYLIGESEGNYSLFVSAISTNLNNTMFSYFSVLDYYEFDIIRETPVTTDPWGGPFTSRINITGSHSPFDFTETIPSRFTVLDTGGAEVSTQDNLTYLRWSNLNNASSVSYVAIPPLVTPELYSLRSYVESEEGIFEEARPWYLAVDPILYAQLCVAQDNSNGQDNYDTACDGTYPNACGGGAADRLTCNDGQYETHAGTNNNRWDGVRISAYDSTIQYCTGITRVDVCYEWWQSAGHDVARIAVDNDNWASATTAVSTVPGAAANPGVTCVDVSSLDNWVCGNFDNTGTDAQVVAQAQRDNSGLSRTLTIDVLFFNVTYTSDYPVSVYSLNYPADGANFSFSQITFNFTARDDKTIQNCSLYMNVSGWSIQGTAFNVTNNTNTNITISPADGRYIWNVRCFDNATTPYNAWYSSNYTFTLDTAGPNTTITDPLNFSNISSTTTYTISATPLDALSPISTVFFYYRRFPSDPWTTISNDTSSPYRATWNLASLQDANSYQLMAYSNDSLGNIGQNYTIANITVDRTGPIATLITPANFSNITIENYIVNATVWDNLSQVNTVIFEYRQTPFSAWVNICTTTPVNGVANCTWDLTSLANGVQYQVQARANDSLGNMGGNATNGNITLSLIQPPMISRIQCYSGGWMNCTEIPYGSTLESVRANCTSNNFGSISNASFILKNIDDNHTFFNSTVFSQTGGYWEYNLNDFNIYDSGDFSLAVTCRENPENTTEYNWTVPWGTLSSSLVSPSNHTNVSRNRFFNFISSISCIGGECGYVEATLDPVSAETADSGTVTDNDGGNDEEGGSYTDTQSNNGVYLAIGENTNGANDNVNSLIDFTFNISSLGITISDLNSMNVSITYCYSGADTYAAINCDGGTDNPEKTANGNQDIWIYNYNTSAWVDIGNLDTAGGETETTDIYVPSGSLADYISNNMVSVRVEYVTNNGNNNDAWLAIDYLNLNVDYTFLKSGAVSTVQGTIPFYTTSSNPQNATHQSCLGNMTAGDTCSVSWYVNATGELGTVHDFFVLYNLTSNRDHVADSSTSHINITIIQNSAPSAVYVNITPAAPGISDNLNCTFEVYDNALDLLSATVYWYESGSLQYSETVNVSRNVPYTHTLGSGNTSASETWKCGIIPYDLEFYGSQMNSTSVNISASTPPAISNLECQRFGVVWGACSNVVYNDQFTAVRATCTDTDGYIVNANFTFSNLNDSYTFFSTNYSSQAGNVFTLDFGDITIQDSGAFNIDVLCLDNSSTANTYTGSWSVPWGTLTSQLISPSTNINVTQNRFFNFTSRVTCSGGECGSINATLDPTPSWWNGNFRYRRRLNITNNQASVLQSGYSMNISINTTSDKFLQNGNDFRVVWLNGANWVELDRINETSRFDTDSTEVWFKLQQAIPSSSYDDTYFIYYGHAGAASPPVNRSKIYLYHDDFNRADVSDINTEAAYGSTGGGTWSISGNKLVNVGAAGDPNKLEIDALGDVSYDVDMWAKINIYSTLGSASDLWRMGLSSNIDDVGGDGQGYCLLFHQDHSSLDLLNDLRSWGFNGAYSWNVDTWYNMRFRVINPSARLGNGKVWLVGATEPNAWTITDGTFGTGTARGYGELGFGGSRQGDTTHFDDIIIRYIVTNIPTAAIGSEEEYGINKGIIPMYTGDPFYTITQNPMNSTTAACLWNMTSGDTCDATWQVNATGTANTTWEFYTLFDSLQYSAISENISRKINITIISNQAPTVTAVNLTPVQPLYSDNLYCNFTVADSSALDILTANVTWYLNGAYNRSEIRTVYSGVSSSVTLGSGNLTAGQVWHCGAV
ncbi:MAG: hypothetical protein HGA85_04755, partial [Nanoarchaeota archaeon]|nr:hypothetical protein [Nanoarchaeota archaeon]